ncbi:hypothetical protein [Vibrio ziniensis]|uniref:Uncharacterized protein n=1 Tax=Vibrio ziniensis TaxID=2711221 RepID=A0A6G7CIF0_9VIBR|nr:hypothetical protein [Vibrio ziniensis]QIH41850.1 hypothetical protein G5S32_07540 [Vibrio ziniensis]
MNTLNIESQASNRLAVKFANFLASFLSVSTKKEGYKGQSFTSIDTTAQRIGCDMSHFNYIS